MDPNKNTKKRFRDYLFGDVDLFLLGIVGLFALAFLIDSRNYNPTAALLPRLVAVITILLVIAAIIQHYWKTIYQDRPLARSDDENAQPKKGGLIWYYNLASVLVYFLLIFIIGLVWASLLYLLLAPFLLGYKKIKIVVCIAGFWIIFFVYVFTKILHARLPLGIIGNFIKEFFSK